jgi:NADH-quinone oxidoreductase subunit C
LSSADTGTDTTETTEAPEPVTDERREALVTRFTETLGDAVVGSHIRPGDDVWIRVTRDAWAETAEVARNRVGLVFFDFLSAIDWLPSPFGRDMDAQEDLVDAEPSAPGEMLTGYAGGDTRFQLLARVYDVESHLGVTLKADLPDDDLSAPTWTQTFLGADWHERETWEMFGITFTGHPHLVHLYLPGAFEGNPLRKDFPLLARRVKPWPGIVDVEPMPNEGDDDADGGAEGTGDGAGGDS